MYNSPIEIFETPMDGILKDMVKRQEEYIFECVMNVGVNVDREELIKALKYDREQYIKGYNDGIEEFAERLKSKMINDTAYGCDCAQNSGYYDYTIKIGDIPDYIDDVKNEMAGDTHDT